MRCSVRCCARRQSEFQAAPTLMADGGLALHGLHHQRASSHGTYMIRSVMLCKRAFSATSTALISGGTGAAEPDAAANDGGTPMPAAQARAAEWSLPSHLT